MISLRYLLENNAKLLENKRKLAIKSMARPTSGLSLPPAMKSAPGNVKGGQDGTNTAPPIQIQSS